MHVSVMKWVSQMVSDYNLAKRPTLEVGSLNVNGTTRTLFHGYYWGVDMRRGRDVNAVHDIETGPVIADRPFEVVVCTEMLEHTPRPWLAVDNMLASLTIHPGYLILTTRGPMFPPHDFPADYYRFTISAIKALLDHSYVDLLDIREDPQQPGVFALARVHEPNPFDY